MKLDQFQQQILLMLHAWPWPPGADGALRDYSDRLWEQAKNWDDESAKLFREIVENRIASGGRRPSVSDVAGAVSYATRSGGDLVRRSDEARAAGARALRDWRAARSEK